MITHRETRSRRCRRRAGRGQGRAPRSWEPGGSCSRGPSARFDDPGGPWPEVRPTGSDKTS